MFGIGCSKHFYYATILAIKLQTIYNLVIKTRLEDYETYSLLA